MQVLLIFLWLLALLFFFRSLLSPILIIFTIIFIVKYTKYKKSAYYQITKQPYFSLRRNSGKYGEYLTYKCLKHFEKNGAKFLFNIYVPKERDETSEIDVLMICKKGLFVFESKNYSGWIFGSENRKNWYQTLPTGRGRCNKVSFYNPIMQNSSHIRYLKAFIGRRAPIKSIIVFSDKCTLKDVQIRSNDVRVINRYNVASVVSDICNQISGDLLTDNDITEIFDKLFPYTQVDETVKKQHISNIHNTLNPQPIQRVNEATAQVAPQIHTETFIEQPEVVNVDTTATVDDPIVLNNTEPTPTDKPEQAALQCPMCNSDLVLRTATKGVNAGKQFYVCSNYPKCKYIQAIAKQKIVLNPPEA